MNPKHKVYFEIAAGVITLLLLVFTLVSVMGPKKTAADPTVGTLLGQDVNALNGRQTRTPRQRRQRVPRARRFRTVNRGRSASAAADRADRRQKLLDWIKKLRGQDSAG